MLDVVLVERSGFGGKPMTVVGVLGSKGSGK